MGFLTGGSFQKTKMKLRYIYIFLISILSGQLYSQEVQLARQVIGSAGSTTQSSTLLISSTVGEAVVGSAINTDGSYTQGFQQSSTVSLATITYDIIVKDETCPDTKDGEITLSNFQGCDNGQYHLEWDNGEEGAHLINLSAGWYMFTLTACGQIIADSVQVGRIYESICLLKFYTAFSPNNDGVNDLWEIDNIDSEVNSRNEVKIFNRWGNVIQTFNNYDNLSTVWDGKTDKGKDATEGTYYYLVEINEKSYSGYIELTR